MAGMMSLLALERAKSASNGLMATNDMSHLSISYKSLANVRVSC